MTVLHSSNADVADVSDLDETPAQDGTSDTDLRAELGRYAELGAFTLSADTHAWYGAVATVATPEDARAASTALAELRGGDLQQTWQSVIRLAGDASLSEPGTVAQAALLVELLQRVHRTSATLDGAAYDTDLDVLAAATAGSAWRRERGVKLSWLRARTLRKQAHTLAVTRLRREDLHEALTSAEVERRAWAVFAPEGTRPTAPADGELVDATAQAFEAINAGLAELARLLPDRDLETLTFVELTELVERLADDEGTLYRLPTIRALRLTLEEAGLADLLEELASARADRRAAEAAYQRHTGGADAARQALAGGQRDGQAEEPQAVAVDTAVDTAAVDAAAADAAAPETAVPETEAVVSIPAPASEDDRTPAAETEAEAAVEAGTEPVEVVAVEAVEVEVQPVEVEAVEDVAVEAEPVVEVVEPVEPVVVETEAAVAAADPEVSEPVTEAATVEVPAEVAEPVAEQTAQAQPEAVAPVVEPVEVETVPVVEIAPVEVAVEPVVEPVEVAVAPAVEIASVVGPVETVPVVEVVVPVVEVAPPVEAVAVAVADKAAQARRPRKPEFAPGKPVAAYSAAELLAVVRWLDTDSVERTDEALLRAAMKEFGFARLGPRIKEALGAAVSEVRG